jgi:hypothetical protein
VGILPEVGTQLRWQQETEAGGLVNALFANEYKHLMVGDTIVQPSTHSGTMPFMERPAEGLLCFFVALIWHYRLGMEVRG